MARFVCKVCGYKAKAEEDMKNHVKKAHINNKDSLSLRNLVKSPLWWVLVVVMWILALLGIFPATPPQLNSQGFLVPTVDITYALDLTILVVVMQVAERLIPPRQSLQLLRKEKGEINILHNREASSKSRDDAA